MSTTSLMSHAAARALAVALLVGLPAASLAARKPVLEPPAVCTEPAPAASAPAAEGEGPRFSGAAFARTELFFGSEREGRPEVSAKEFAQFLDAVVTPCFPDGLTLLTGKGQFRESDGEIVQETSFVLVLLYPQSLRQQSDARIEAIRALYKEHFQQESVLRVDDARLSRVGF